MFEVVITAYRVSNDGGTTVRYVATYGRFAGDPVPTGTRVYVDKTLLNFLETANVNSYKYCGTIGKNWTQPVMAQDQTVLGGDIWGFSAPNGTSDAIWQLSDGNLQQHVASGHRSRPYPYRFYNPNPLTIRSFRVCNSYEDYITGYDFQCSDDGSNWTTLTSGSGNTSSYAQWTFSVPNSGAHQYYQFRVVSGTDGDWQNLSELTMYGTQNVVDDPETTVIPEVRNEKIYLILDPEAS
jgi:hypothetical protein